MRVLLVASDSRIGEDVATALAAENVIIQTTAHTAALGEVVADWKPDLLIADTDMGQGEAVAGLRQAASELPLIALTRASDVSDRLSAFEHGADDVLHVPFAARELVARCAALLRRARQSQAGTGVLCADRLEINVLRRRATLGGVDLRLTPVEQSLLYLLASNPGRVLSRDQILDAVWGRRFSAESNLVDRHIRNLRAKLHDDWREPRFILTVNGRGYAFRGDDASQSLLEIGQQSVV